MTREELLKGLHWVKNWKCNGDGDVHEIISEAIEALEAQADSDTISRHAAIDVLDRNHILGQGLLNDTLDHIADAIIALPPAQPETHEERTETHACDCIERQAAISVIAKWMLEYGGEGEERERNALKQAAEEIKELPPAQPEVLACGEGELIAQPEIVRCRDCKYWMPHSQLGYDEDNETYHDYCEKLIPEDEYYAFYRDADDYCSRAERRTDEGDYRKE